MSSFLLLFFFSGRPFIVIASFFVKLKVCSWKCKTVVDLIIHANKQTKNYVAGVHTGFMLFGLKRMSRKCLNIKTTKKCCQAGQ